jgi:hypothetical protein
MFYIDFKSNLVEINLVKGFLCSDEFCELRSFLLIFFLILFFCQKSWNKKIFKQKTITVIIRCKKSICGPNKR